MVSKEKVLTHSGLAKRVAKRTGLPIRHVQAILSETGDAIGIALAEGYTVRLRRLGVLSASVHKTTKRLVGGKLMKVLVPQVRVAASTTLKKRLKLNAALNQSEASGK